MSETRTYVLKPAYDELVERIDELEQICGEQEASIIRLECQMENLIDVLHTYSYSDQEDLYQILARRGL